MNRHTLPTSLKCLVALATAMPLLAAAQFTVLDQRGSVYAVANSSETPYTPIDWTMATVPPGDLSSQNLKVDRQVGEDFLVRSQGSFQTVASTSEVGISSDIALEFSQMAATLPTNLYVEGSISVRGSLTFAVNAETDVQISGMTSPSPWLGYTNLVNAASLGRVYGTITGSLDNSPLPPYLTMPVSSSGGLAHLTPGTYLLTVQSDYSAPIASSAPAYDLSTGTMVPGHFITPLSLGKIGASLTVTAVPEPSTLLLSALALAGVALARRRHAVG